MVLLLTRLGFVPSVQTSISKHLEGLRAALIPGRMTLDQLLGSEVWSEMRGLSVSSRQRLHKLASSVMNLCEKFSTHEFEVTIILVRRWGAIDPFPNCWKVLMGKHEHLPHEHLPHEHLPPSTEFLSQPEAQNHRLAATPKFIRHVARVNIGCTPPEEASWTQKTKGC
jgi:hypothetical protein